MDEIESLYCKQKVDMLVTEFTELAENLNANLLELHGAANALRLACQNALAEKFAEQQGAKLEMDSMGRIVGVATEKVELQADSPEKHPA